MKLCTDLQYTHTDGGAFQGGMKAIRLSEEVAELLFHNKKAIVGACGSVNDIGTSWEWFTDPSQKIPRLRAVEFVALTGDKAIYTSSNLNNWVRVDSPYYAIGSGKQYAIAALEAGKSPKKAVEIACKYDVYSGKGVAELKV